MNWLREMRNRYRVLMEYKRQHQQQRGYDVQFYNIWEGQRHDELYWYQFLKAKGLNGIGRNIAFFSCFGPKEIIDYVKADVKVFISGENLTFAHYAAYANHALDNSSIDFSMGLAVVNNPRYIRFPLWMDYMFPADSAVDDIRKKCVTLRYPILENKDKFCCMIASNSANGLRKEMMEKIGTIDHVDSAGRFMHNDDSLQAQYADKKLDYMRQYIFNICPENSSAYGYTTEKLFEAISCGCIPIYWGAELADKDVINEDALVFWNREDDGKEAIKKITELYSNPKLMEEFMRQPRLMPTAEEYVLDTFATIETRFRKLIYGL